jgi:gliding motility-associated-like protein
VTVVGAVRVHAVPTGAFSYDPGIGCMPLEVHFNARGTATFPLTFGWDFGDGHTGMGAATDHAYQSAGTFTPLLHLTSPLPGCSVDIASTGSIIVWPTPEADFTYLSRALDERTMEVAFADASSADAVNWAWSFPGGLPGTSSAQDPTVQYPNGAENVYPVSLLVTNRYGCTASTTVLVELHGPLQVFVPNAFTPDEDGVNDTWRPVLYEADDDDYTVRVFDRWGTEVWSSAAPDGSWDGRVGGREPVNGVYVWRLRVHDARDRFGHELVGHVTVVR